MTLEQIMSEGGYSALSTFLRTHSDNNQAELVEALCAAIMEEDIACVRLLLENGANPNSIPDRHLPPLQCAVEQEDVKLIKLLCEYGADVNFSTKNGFSPLHLAVDVEADTAWQAQEVPTAELVQLLLSLGADPNLRDVNGKTPLTIAEEYDFSSAIELLRERTSKI